MALKLRKDIKKSSYYVWFLGAKESKGLRGSEFIIPVIKHLEEREKDVEPFKVTLQVSHKGLKIIQNVVSQGAKNSKPKNETIKHFIPHNTITCVYQHEDIIACILLLFNPVTKCPLHVHAYRCDSLETATLLKQQLQTLIDRPENQKKFAEIENRLKPPQKQAKKVESSLGSDTGTSTRESESSEERFAVETSRVSTLYDSVAAELREKLGKNNVPILLPPRDYDTVHRQKGNLTGIELRRCLNASIVGQNVKGRRIESSGGSSGIGSDHPPSPDSPDAPDTRFNTLDNQSSSGSAERKRLIAMIRNKGSFMHNTHASTSQTNLIVSRRPKNNEIDSKLYKMCPGCSQLFSKNSIRKHYARCLPNRKSGDRYTSVLGKQMFHQIHSKASSIMKNEIMSVMREDEIFALIIYDELIILYGNSLCRKYRSKHFHKMIRSKLRLMGRLLKSLRRANRNISDFASIFNACSFETVVQATNEVALLNNEGDEYKSPATAFALGTLLKKCGRIYVTECIKNGDKERQTEIEDFLKIIDEEFSTSVNRIVMENQKQQKRNKKIVLPKADDIKTLYSYVRSNAHNMRESLNNKFDVYIWKRLASFTLTTVQIFNRRRSGEIERMMISEFNAHQSISGEDPDLLRTLSEEDGRNALKYVRLTIRGKRSRGVPVLLDKETLACITTILKLRKAAGVPDSNPFVFGIPGSDTQRSHLSACALMREFSETCGATNPNSLRGTTLRKKLCTQSAVLDLQNDSISDLANFMGHADKVHREHYRLPVISRDIARVSNLLEIGVAGASTDPVHQFNMESDSDFESGKHVEDYRRTQKDKSGNKDEDWNGDPAESTVYLMHGAPQVTLPRPLKNHEREKSPDRMDFRHETRFARYSDPQPIKYNDEGYKKPTYNERERERDKEKQHEITKYLEKPIAKYAENKYLERQKSLERERKLERQKSTEREKTFERDRHLERQKSVDSDRCIGRQKSIERASDKYANREDSRDRYYQDRDKYEKFADADIYEKFDNNKYIREEPRVIEREKPMKYFEDDGFEDSVRTRNKYSDMERLAKYNSRNEHYNEDLKREQPVPKVRQRYAEEDQKYYDERNNKYQPEIRYPQNGKSTYIQDDSRYYDPTERNTSRPKQTSDKYNGRANEKSVDKKYFDRSEEKKYFDRSEEKKLFEAEIKSRSKSISKVDREEDSKYFPTDVTARPKSLIEKYKEFDRERDNRTSRSEDDYFEDTVDRRRLRYRQRSPSPEEMKVSPKDRFKDAKEKFLLMERERLEEQRRNRIETPISPVLTKDKPFIKRHESMMYPNTKERERYEERFFEDKRAIESPRPAPRHVQEEVRYRRSDPRDISSDRYRNTDKYDPKRRSMFSLIEEEHRKNSSEIAKELKRRSYLDSPNYDEDGYRDRSYQELPESDRYPDGYNFSKSSVELDKVSDLKYVKNQKTSKNSAGFRHSYAEPPKMRMDKNGKKWTQDMLHRTNSTVSNNGRVGIASVQPY